MTDNVELRGDDDPGLMRDTFDPAHDRRRSESDDGMPWQIKALGFIGVPATIALYLVWSLVNGIVPSMLQMNLTMTQVAATLSNITVEHMAAKAQNERVIQILSATCANAAKTPDSREGCFR